MILKNSLFTAEFDTNGIMTSLVLNDDPFCANGVLASDDEPWVPKNKQWGLGFISSGHNHIQIEKCESASVSENIMRAEYTAEYTDPRFACVWNGDIGKSRVERKIKLRVTRELKDDALHESYTFVNYSDKFAVLDEIGIYSTFRDTYASGENVLHTHFNQHICTCGDLCYIEAQRQSNKGKNLALITTDGAFDTYQLEEQNTSNVRGVVALVAKDVRIEAGGEKTFSRIIVPCDDRSDFEQKLCNYTGFPVVDFGIMTVETGETVRLTVKNKGKLEEIKIEGVVLKENNGIYEYTPDFLGVHKGKIKYNGKIAQIKYNVIDNIKTLLTRRVEFIVANQQVNDPKNPLYGAFLPYDIEKEEIFTAEENHRIYHAIPDRNEVRERMGMGAFIALYSRLFNTKKYLPALERYRDFLLKYIVDENYDVWDSYLKQGGAKYYHEGMVLVERELDMRSRTYNYAFAVPFFAEMYHLTSDEAYAKVAAGIMKRYYEVEHQGGFMPNVSVLGDGEFNDKSITEKISEIRKAEKAIVTAICRDGENYPPDEVAYEHGVPSGRLKYLTEYYIENGGSEIIDGINDTLSRVVTFDGNQPDFHINGNPIRHWDAFWFGKYEMWGDTFPHWVSCLSSSAYANCYRITNDEKFRTMANKIFRANISLIRRDGSAYNSYLFNEKSNGRPAGRYDPLSNDQDQIYYYYLKACENGVYEL